MNFADRVEAAVRARRSQIVLGLDPDPLRLLPQALDAAGEGSPADRAAEAVTAHCRLLIAASAEACVAVKPQLACFERLGAPGWNALSKVAAAARDAGLLVIADAKRGDVPHTAEAYGQALLGETPTPWGAVPGLGADAVTANPLLGQDSLEPIVSAVCARGSGVFVLVRTSNPGAAALQDDGAGEPLHVKLARLVHRLGATGKGDCGLSDTGAVVAATRADMLASFRELMPEAIFLLPGVGAQGGRAEDLGPAFGPGRGAALVAASRAITEPALDAGDAAAAGRTAERLRETVWKLSG